MIALRTGAMRYGIFTWRREAGSMDVRAPSALNKEGDLPKRSFRRREKCAALRKPHMIPISVIENPVERSNSAARSRRIAR